MKVPYLLCLLTIISIKGHSQEYEYVAFPDLGAIWSEIYYHPEPTWPDTVHKPPSFERFAVSGEDTIINEFTYKKLYIFYDTVFVKNNATYVGGIREDEHKRIYFISDTVIHEHKPMNEFYNYEEIILYDFSLKVGDTIRNINCIPDDDRLVVKRIDTIQIGNTFRKRFSFDPVSWVQWIEGIGNLRGLLFTSGDLPFNGTYGDLICFKQNGKILYFNDNYPDCLPLINGISEIKHIDWNITIYPNPSDSNEINFDFQKQAISKIQVFDAQGRIKASHSTEGRSSYVLSIKKYQPGLYYYVATDKYKMKHTGKFIVL